MTKISIALQSIGGITMTKMTNTAKQLDYSDKIISFPKLQQDDTQVQQGNKKKGKKSEVYDFSLEDAKKIADYFVSHEKWIHFLMFVISCNLARRNEDILALKWYHFFDPTTGNIRDDLEDIQEQKTKKIAKPRINSAVRNAIHLYLDKVHFDPSTDNYSWNVFHQFTGTYAGKTLSYDGCRKAIKAAAKAVGITYNVAMHSDRKTFGAMSRMLHPHDQDSMEILGQIYNHSSAKITRRYIGITKKKIDAYYDDLGTAFDEYVIGGKELTVNGNSIVSLDINDLRSIVTEAYKAGMQNADNAEAVAHIEAINQIMALIDGLCK